MLPTTTDPISKIRYGPQQLRDLLDLADFQYRRATDSGAIPPPDAKGEKWTAAAVRPLFANRAAIRRHAGGIPDLGETRAAEYLTTQLRITVEPHALPELARSGDILIVGHHKGHPLYCGRTLETWTMAAPIHRANIAGERLTADRVADQLGVRRVDVDHLVTRGWLKPVDMARGPFTPNSRHPDVPLYRAGDVITLNKSDEIDWAAIRAATKGQRSPLASLPQR